MALFSIKGIKGEIVYGRIDCFDFSNSLCLFDF